MIKRNYIVKILTHNLRLPRYVSFFESKISDIDVQINHLGTQVTSMESQLENQIVNSQALERSLSDISTRLDSVIHLINTSRTTTAKSENHPVVNGTVSDDHTFDHFYKSFEDKFRGTEEEIYERLLEHLPLFSTLSGRLKKLPIIDIGCGRGELLKMLANNNFHPVGIDMNESMVARAKEQGYEAYAIDAASYLRSLRSGSVAAVTGFHIAEHIPFEIMVEIIQECHRVIAKSGFVLFETPNPESLSVGAHTFYLDPSHQRPIPPQLLDFMVQYGGFSTDILRLHKLRESPKNISNTLQEVYESIYGYADYAVLGRKSL